MRNFRRLLLLAAAIASLAQPLNADITFSTQRYPNYWDNPTPSAENIETFIRAIHLLADDPRLANHPIRRYLNSPNYNAHIIFDNPTLNFRGVMAFVDFMNNDIILPTDRDLGFYLRVLAHEFIHIEMREKYGDLNFTGFLSPEDFAFLNIMEEAFARGVDLWVHVSFPEHPHNPRTRNWTQQTSPPLIAEAKHNDLRADFPNMTAGQISAQVGAEMVRIFLTLATVYSLRHVPDNMEWVYGRMNTFLIPDYAVFRERGDALLRHQWNHLASMMPFTLPSHMTYDFFRSQFRANYINWANRAASPDNSILHWINFPAEEEARARMARQRPEDRRYDFLTREDEARLNRVMQEIDPSFRPVDTTATSFDRLLQDMHQQMQQNQRR